jgi:hypothetical protein
MRMQPSIKDSPHSPSLKVIRQPIVKSVLATGIRSTHPGAPA